MLKHMAKIRRVALCHHKDSGMAWIIASKLKGKCLKSYISGPIFQFLKNYLMEPSKVFLLKCSFNSLLAPKHCDCTILAPLFFPK